MKTLNATKSTKRTALIAAVAAVLVASGLLLGGCAAQSAEAAPADNQGTQATTQQTDASATLPSGLSWLCTHHNDANNDGYCDLCGADCQDHQNGAANNGAAQNGAAQNGANASGNNSQSGASAQSTNNTCGTCHGTYTDANHDGVCDNCVAHGYCKSGANAANASGNGVCARSNCNQGAHHAEHATNGNGHHASHDQGHHSDYHHE